MAKPPRRNKLCYFEFEVPFNHKYFWRVWIEATAKHQARWGISDFPHADEARYIKKFWFDQNKYRCRPRDSGLSSVFKQIQDVGRDEAIPEPVRSIA